MDCTIKCNDRRKTEYYKNRSVSIDNKTCICGNELNKDFKTCDTCRLWAKDYRNRLKEEVIAAYGGKCSCCNEDEIIFLTIDRIDNTGTEHYTSMSSNMKHYGTKFYKWIKNNNYPKDNLRCLCWNCNSGRQVNGGICPHITDNTFNQ